MTLLITGGAGFIGSALIRHLIANTGERVVNLDKLTYAGNLQSLAAVAGPRVTPLNTPTSATVPRSSASSRSTNPAPSCTWPPKATLTAA